ncbi:MAG: RNA methyltransferase, partial [Candidatus Woesearchaeota archaeon]
MTKIIIEHLDKRLWKWSLMEYKHASELIGKENIIFTNIKTEKSIEKLKDYGLIYKEKIEALLKKENSKIDFKKACILDPFAKETLKPSDKFDYLIIGGILGDYPPQKRTRKELTSKLNFTARNLGKVQMSTNTAAYVAWKIVNGFSLEKMKFKKLKIKIGKYQEVILPYRYLIENNDFVIPKGYIEMAK